MCTTPTPPSPQKTKQITNNKKCLAKLIFKVSTQGAATWTIYLLLVWTRFLKVNLHASHHRGSGQIKDTTSFFFPHYTRCSHIKKLNSSSVSCRTNMDWDQPKSNTHCIVSAELFWLNDQSHFCNRSGCWPDSTVALILRVLWHYWSAVSRQLQVTTNKLFALVSTAKDCFERKIMHPGLYKAVISSNIIT